MPSTFARAALGLLLALPAQRLAAQVDSERGLPFGVGERLTYRARVAKAGNIGRGAMWIEGPVDVRGTSTYLLRFDFKAGVGPVRAEDRTSSWLDARRMASLRFAKHERHPLSNSDQKVEILPDERRWHAEGGEAGSSLSDMPLDELSFMYFLRTLPLDADTVLSFDRHFEAARNPTTVRVVRRDTVVTGAGTFRTVLLEMRVRDARHYRGEGVIRIHLSDDACRLPVRIESGMPVIGTAVLTLESDSGVAGECAARMKGRE
ncbi:MAG TPA: DUF3108 domain-containing protein [Gemmatimonadaceae bacterium]|nr:DUF3108 domain-containing protein [Gemmatimonadaceae bacterium]